MPVISVRIPQLGEGLQEALLVEFLKMPGDQVTRDEPIYVMETDKATTDVESPYEGKLIEWTVETGSVLEIGTEIAKMEVAEGVKEMPIGHGPEEESAAQLEMATTTSTRSSTVVRSAEVKIPPRTRKYLKDKGLLNVAAQIPAKGSKLMPEDVDRYLAATTQVSSDEYSETALPQTQITLNYRLTRGAQVCVPVTVMNEIDWSAIDAARNETRESGGASAFLMSCWCAVQALKKHDKLRSSLSSDGKRLRTFHHVNLGIAVALPGDEMLTAVVRHADEMSQGEFFVAAKERITEARDGKDQVDESTTITVSNIGIAGMRIGIPAVVAPAVATLAIGETYSHPVPKDDGYEFRRMVIATMSFDHRVANGIGAANFMMDFKSEAEGFELA